MFERIAQRAGRSEQLDAEEFSDGTSAQLCSVLFADESRQLRRDMNDTERAVEADQDGETSRGPR